MRYIVLLVLSVLSVPSLRAQDPSVNWCCWFWEAPTSPLPNTEWYDYGWDSTSNGPISAALAQRPVLPPALPTPSTRIHSLAPIGGEGRGEGVCLVANRDHSRNPYQAGEFTISPYASLRVHDFDGRLERVGSGLAVSYSLSRTVALEAETLTENPQHNLVDEAGLNLKAYLPLGKTGFAPYGLMGATKEFEHNWDWRMNAGAGIEFRAAKTFGVFVDGRWTHNFRDIGHALFRAGLQFRF